MLSDPSPASSPAPIAMDRGSVTPRSSRGEVMERISKALVVLLHTLNTVNLDITIYQLSWHTVEDIQRHPSDWKKLDGTYTKYEEQVNSFRRTWMELRAASEQEPSKVNGGGNSSAPGSRPAERSPSPLEYLSEACEKENELPGIKVNGEDALMDLDPVERDIPRRPAPATGPPPPKPRQKKDNPTTSRTVIATPSGSTSCRLAPIPKGAKLSVEKTRIPTPQNPFTFNMPRKLLFEDLGRKPPNRSKRNHLETCSSLNSSSSLPSSSGATGVTTQTSVSASPRRNYTSAKEYCELRRDIRPSDFQMDEDRWLNSLECLGPPFDVKTEEITHNTLPASYADLRTIYGVGHGLTPKVSPDKLAKHGFHDWMIPNMDCHPFVPARPGWPGLVLQLNEDLEEWEPEDGREFRVVIKKEPRFVEYVGQYEMLRLSDITGDEWRQQPAKVRNAWIRVIGGGVLWKDPIARVALRKKLGKEPSMAEFSKYIDKLNYEDYRSLAGELKEDVDEAFRMGEEIIAVWGMRCVGYDYKFEKHLARSLKGIKPTSSGLPRKRKAPAVDSEDEGGDKEPDSESEDTSPSKRQRAAKGKAKSVKYDWSGATHSSDSQDEDYRPD